MQEKQSNNMGNNLEKIIVELDSKTLDLQFKNKGEVKLQIFSDCHNNKSEYQLGITNTKETSKKDKNKSAAERYRQKRRNQICNLENNVQSLQQQISKCDQQLKKLQYQIQSKLNQSNNNNQHKSIYAQLAINASTEQPDLDKINLLLDTLKYRIGAYGKERQAKIDYNCKQIINTVFPALYRYLMHIAHSKFGFFNIDNSELDWSKELFSSLKLSLVQRQKIMEYREKILNIRNRIKQDICELNHIKEKIKSDGQTLQNIMDDIRKEIHPVQSANWILFLQKHKYREFISFSDSIADKEENFEEQYPRKIRKVN